MADVLPTMLISPTDVRRAKRELEAVDDFLHQAGLRRGGKAVKLPQTSRLVDELVREADINLLHATDRQKLIDYLDELDRHAPVVHVSFASEPSASFMAKLVVWLRANIHPQLLVHLGLQPSIAAGCIIRTANKQFDFSLAQAFDKQRELLVASLKSDQPLSNVAAAKETTT